MNSIIVFFLLFLDLVPGNLHFVSSAHDSIITQMISKNTDVANKGPEIQHLSFSPLPQVKIKETPDILAKSYFAFDLDTGYIFFAKNQNEKNQIASLTKLMTALILISNQELSTQVTVGDLSLVRLEDATMNLQVGEILTLEDLLKGILISSASDAAVTIAQQTFAGDYDKFISHMNRKASDLGMMNTHFDNPVGWDSDQNYSTASDMARLARIVLRNRTIQNIVSTPKTTITSQSGQIHQLINTNVLLDGQVIYGLKTGFTNGAGGCLATFANINKKNVLTIVLGSSQRFEETKSLLSSLELGYNW